MNGTLNFFGRRCLFIGMSRERITQPCPACDGKRTCRFSIDAWVCFRCGAEWPLVADATAINDDGALATDVPTIGTYSGAHPVSDSG